MPGQHQRDHRWQDHWVTRGLAIATIAAVAYDAGSRGLLRAAAGEAAGASQLLLGNPSLPTCPTSNCPVPPRPSVLSTQFIHGETTKGATQAEWLSNIGLFVRTGAPDGQKVAQYVGVMQDRGAGTAWALNTDLVRNAGRGGPNAIGSFEGSGKPGAPGAIGERNGSIGYELDFTNWDADSSPGRGAFTVGQYVHAQGSFTSLSALYFDATMAASNRSFGWTDGILFNGDRVVKDNTFYDGTAATNSLSIAGRHEVGLNTTEANGDLRAVAMKEGQSVCFGAQADCLLFRDGRLLFRNKAGKVVFALSENGDVAVAGRLTQQAAAASLDGGAGGPR